MKMFAYHFRHLAGWERVDRWCRMATENDAGAFQICGHPAVIQFEGTRAATRGQERSERLDYCETHGAHVAALYGARIEAGDEAA